MDRGARWGIVHGVAKSRTQLSDSQTHMQKRQVKADMELCHSVLGRIMLCVQYLVNIMMCYH